MSVQILVQGKLAQVAQFLSSPAQSQAGPGGMEALLAGRSHWVSLLTEVVPRALIAELGLPKILLGSSGAGQFLVILPSDARAHADAFLAAARAAVKTRSNGELDLVWAITENLGDWTVVRKRLNEELRGKENMPLAQAGNAFFDQETPAPVDSFDSYFIEDIGRKLREAQTVSWSPEDPAAIELGPGKYEWALREGPDAIPLARQAALTDDGSAIATAAQLGARSQGRPVWGVLRGDADDFGVRIRRAASIEEHVQLSILYKQFFAGELELLCTMPEFWSKVTLFYSGGDDFAVYGAWDALILLAREVQRVFERFAQENLNDFPGPEGKTISMALALAEDEDALLETVFETAGQRLNVAKTTDKNCFHLLGRTLEWKQLADAAELKDDLTRMVTDFGVPANYLQDLCAIYRESMLADGRRSSKRQERPWRFHRRLNRVLATGRTRDFQKARNSLVADLVGKNAAQFKLRPSGRVALEWARLSVGG
jgi:CRISPR-associated protein Csm1